jgi:hypothetical protein
VDQTQRLLQLLVRHGVPAQTDSMGEWFTLVPNDPDELGHMRSSIGVQVKIAGDTSQSDGSFQIVDVITYNR